MLNYIKCRLLKWLAPKGVHINGKVKILGGLPHFKIPKNGKIQFAKNVVLNSDFKSTNTALTYKCKFVTGYDGEISIGEGTMLNGACVVAYSKVSIGKYCQIASSTIISDTDFHPVDPAQRLKQAKGESFSFNDVGKRPISIGDNVWIGWNCTILKGVTLGDNCIVAAGSVVLQGDYGSNALIAGNPAKVIKHYSSKI